MCRTMGVVAVLLMIVPFLWSDSPPAPPTTEQLIEQLNHKDFAVRQAAERAIEEKGPEALPALRKALAAKPSLEVGRRIERWIPQFELAALSDPKRVTLTATGQPLQEVIEQIAKQSGYPLTLQPDADKEKKPCDFKFERATFWEALDAVCASGGMIANRDREQKGFQLQFSDNYQPFVHRHGAFRVVGQGFQYSYSHHRQRSNQFGMVPRKPAANKSQGYDNESESLHLNLQVEAEPRIAVASLGDVSVSEATDDRNRSLTPEASPDQMRFRRIRAFARAGDFFGRNLTVDVPLKAPAKDAKKLAVLKGTIMVHLEKEKKTTVLAEKVLETRGKKVQLGKTTISIEEAKKGDDGEYDLYLTMTGGEQGQGELEGDLKLLDEKGNAYQITNSGSTGNGKRTKLRLGFVPPFGVAAGPATKLVYVTRVTMKYTLPFEFRDLPLP